MRIAFLTPEFVTEQDSAGGLASYLSRITAALRDLGHEPEVFTLSPQRDVAIVYDGIRVQRVRPTDTRLTRLLTSHWRMHRMLSGTVSQLRGAAALATAMQRRHAEAPFDAVQSADYGLTGLFVTRCSQRTHLVRCSWSRSLYEAWSDRPVRLDNRILRRLERRCLRRADVAYAPSRFIAERMTREARRPVAVVRPPLPATPSPAESLQLPDLPDRYLLHFGLLSRLKGTDVVAAALPKVWAQAPDFRLVMAGREATPGYVSVLRSGWCGRQEQVMWLGPLPRPQMQAVLARATATVLPSRCDNLPNTVIESLSRQVPVIGSAGASIDELVEPGRTGELTPIGDADALADAMLQAWRGQLPCQRPSGAVAARLSDTLGAMHTEPAARALIRLAGYADGDDWRGKLAA